MSSNSINILCIGDPHLRIEDYEDITIYFDQLLSIFEQIISNMNQLDYIIILGDVLHNHSIVHTQSLNLALQFFNMCKSFAKTFCLVGNHDYINNDQFCTTNHWMNSCKEWDNNFIVIDKPETFIKNNIQITLSPYIPDGKFINALETTELSFLNSDIIFGHQLLNGAKMGAIIENSVEEWKDEYPLLISGHIHSVQKVKHNLQYLGSSRYVGYGDTTKKYCRFIKIKKENAETKIELKYIRIYLPIKQTFTILLNESFLSDNFVNDYLNELKVKFKGKQVKLIFKGSHNIIKSFKQTSYYKSISNENKIVFKITTPLLSNQNEINTTTISTTKSFVEILKKQIENGGEEMMELYKKFVNNENTK
jgi:DNA repair exonuclease SbcCD nuclease subunit